MSEYRCRCGQRPVTIAVSTNRGEYVTAWCEHCDRPCTVYRCPACVELAHSPINPT